MPALTRRNVLRTAAALAIPAGVVTLIAGCQQPDSNPSQQSASNADELNAEIRKPNQSTAGDLMKIHYLEIVTPEVDALCAQYSALHDVTFGEADINLGGARTAKLSDGSMLGIRSPMHDKENPVVRPYVLVDDIKASVDAAAEGGAEIALPPMEIPGHGTCAIFIQGGIDCGLWQV